MSKSGSNDDSIEVFMQISPEMLDKLDHLSDELDCDVASVVALGINLLGIVVEKTDDGSFVGFASSESDLDSVIDVSGITGDH